MKKQSILYMILAALALSVLVAGVRSSETAGGPDATLAAWAEAAATATPAPTPSPASTPTPMPLRMQNREDHPALMHLTGEGLFRPEEDLTYGELAQALEAMVDGLPEGEDALARLTAAGVIEPGMRADRNVGRMALYETLDRLSVSLPGKESDRAEEVAQAVEEQTLLTQSEARLTRREAAVALVKLSGRTPDEGRLILGEGLPGDVDADDEAWAWMADAATEGEIPLREEGVYRLHGWLYAADENGELIRSGTYGVWSFDADGRYTTGNASLDEKLRQALIDSGADELEGEEALQAVYLYVKNNFEYIVTPRDQTPEEVGSTGWEFQRASRFFRYGGGTCYGYAAAFGLLARCLGENAQIVAATVNQFNGPHSFVVIPDQWGTDWIYDVELEDTRPERHEDLDLFHIQNFAVYNYWYTPDW